MLGATFDEAPEVPFEMKGCVRGVVQELVDELRALPGTHAFDDFVQFIERPFVVMGFGSRLGKEAFILYHFCPLF